MSGADWEPDYDIWDITIEGGKYQFSRDKVGINSALRHGEPWPAWVDLYKEHLKFSHWFSSLMTEFNTARDALCLLGKHHGLSYITHGLTKEEAAVVTLAVMQAAEKQK